MRSIQFILVLLLFVGGNAIYAAAQSELIKAVFKNNVAKVEQLLAQGADVNQRDEKGDTALIVAAREGSASIVDLLLKAKAEVNVQNNNGHTALIDAVNMGYMPIVQMLLAHGADPDIKTGRYGRSAHGFAVGKNNQAMRDILRSVSTKTNTDAKPITLELNGKSITRERFQQAATRALARRHWKLESQEPEVVVGVLERKNRLYKTKIWLEAGEIRFAYIPGYGMSKANYLLNLRRDMGFELGIYD